MSTQKTATRVSSVWYRAQRGRELLRYLVIGIIPGFLFVAGPYQVLSQGVRLDAGRLRQP